MLWFLFTVVQELLTASRGSRLPHLSAIENTCTTSPSSYDHSENTVYDDESEMTSEDASDLCAAVKLSLQSM